ncbi:MAG: hypothetical protein AAB593_00110 [Patescibacteria group bacterium]
MKNSTIWWIILIIIIILGAYFLFTSNESVNIENEENIIPAEETNLEKTSAEPTDVVSEDVKGSASEENILNEDNKDIPVSQ